MRALAFSHLLFTLAAIPQDLATDNDAAIRQVVQRYLAARENNDPQALEKLFTEDADQLVSSGEWRKGRAEVVRGTLRSSQSSGGHRTINIETVRFVSPGVAIADGHYELSNLAGNGRRSMWTSFVLLHAPDGWRIAAIRNMLPAPPVPVR